MGVPEGARTADYDIDKLNYAVSKQKAETEQKKAEQNKEEPYSYKTDPDFSSEIAYINANPVQAYEEIQSIAQDLIAKYGYEGYQELLKVAKAAAGY